MDGIMTTSAKVAMKIALVMGDLENFAKDGTNKHQNYSYVSIQQVSDTLRELMSKHKLVCVPAIGTVQLAPDGLRYMVEMNFTLIDADSGECLAIPWVSEALTMAGKDDKAIGKAVAYAVKYFLMRLFLASSADDVDNDSHTPPPANNNQRPQQPPKAQPKPENVTPMPQPTPPAADKEVASDKDVQTISITFSKVGYDAAQADFAISSVCGGRTDSRKLLHPMEAAHLIALQNAYLQARGVYGKENWTDEAANAMAKRVSKERIVAWWEMNGPELMAVKSELSKGRGAA